MSVFNLVIWGSSMRHELWKFNDNTPIYVTHNLWQLLCPYASIVLPGFKSIYVWNMVESTVLVYALFLTNSLFLMIRESCFYIS